VLLLAACQSAPVKDVESRDVSGSIDPSALAVVEKKRVYAITEQGLGDILAAEWQGQARAFDEAGRLYSRAAMETDDPEVTSRAVVIATYNEQWGQVLTLSRHWAQLQPEIIKPLEFQLVSALHLDDTDSAKSSINKVIELAVKKQLPAWQLAAQSIVRAHAAPGVDDLLRWLKAEAPVESHAYIVLIQSQLAYKHKNHESAQVLARSAVALDPESKDSYIWLAQLARKSGDMHASLDALKNALQLDESDQALRVEIAQTLKASGDIKSAISLLLDGDDSPELLALAGMMLVDIDKPRALKILDALGSLAVTPLDLYQTGLLAEVLGRNEQAVAYYHQVRDAPYRADAALREVVVLDKLGRMEAGRSILRSIRHWQEADWPQSYLFEADMLSRAGQYQESFDVLTRGLGLEPDNVELRYARALGAEKVGRIDILEGDLRAILMEKPEDADALNALGYTLADHGYRLDESYDLISRALQINPQSPAILDSMGWVLYRQGKANDALIYLQRALSAKFDAEIALHLIEVLHGLDRMSEALDLLGRVNVPGPSFEKIQALIKRLGLSAE